MLIKDRTPELELSVFDPKSDSWQTLPRLTAEYDLGIIATSDGGLVVATDSEEAHRYVPAAKAWKALTWEGDWVSQLFSGGASTGVIYAAYPRALIAVDPLTLRPKPGPFSGMRGTTTVGAPMNGRVSVGHQRENKPAHVAALELHTGKWLASTEPPPKAQTVSLPAALPVGADRKSFGAVRLPDGRLFISGGMDDREFYKDGWLHDPKRASWTRTADLLDSYYHHGMAMLDEGAVLAVDHDRQAAVYDVANDVWVPTLPPPRKLGETTLIQMRRGHVMAIGDSILSSRAAAFEVGRSFVDAPAMKAVGFAKHGEHTVVLAWDHATADRAWAKCEARDLYETPKPRTCEALRPTDGTLSLAFADDPSRDGVTLTPVLKARRSVHQIQLSQHVHKGTLTKIDTFARMLLAQHLYAPENDSASFTAETLESEAVVVVNSIGTHTFDVINRPLRSRGVLAADGSMRDVKVEGDEKDPRHSVSQALGKMMQLARPVGEAGKTYAVGETWTASIRLGLLGELMKAAADPSVQVQETSSAAYEFVGWRRRGQQRLAAIAIRGRVTALADIIPGVVGGTRIAAVMRTMATFYWDPEVGEPAYIELVATAAFHSGDDKYGIQTIGRFFSLRVE